MPLKAIDDGFRSYARAGMLKVNGNVNACYGMRTKDARELQKLKRDVKRDIANCKILGKPTTGWR